MPDIILSSYLRDTGRPGRHRERKVYSSPSTLATHLVNPDSVDAYLLSPSGHATYCITNSHTPHVARRVSRFTCLWEVSWNGGGIREHSAFWSPAHAPGMAQQNAAIIHTLFAVMAQALGLQCNRTYHMLSMAMCAAR